MPHLQNLLQQRLTSDETQIGRLCCVQEYLELSSVTDGVSQHESRWVQGVAAPLTPKLGSFSPLCSSDSLTDDYRYKIQGLAEFVVYGGYEFKRKF